MSLTCLSHVSHLSRTWRPQKMRISVGHTGHHSDSTATTTTRPRARRARGDEILSLNVACLNALALAFLFATSASLEHPSLAICPQTTRHASREVPSTLFSKTGARLFFLPLVWPSFPLFPKRCTGSYNYPPTYLREHQHTCENPAAAQRDQRESTPTKAHNYPPTYLRESTSRSTNTREEKRNCRTEERDL